LSSALPLSCTDTQQMCKCCLSLTLHTLASIFVTSFPLAIPLLAPRSSPASHPRTRSTPGSRSPQTHTLYQHHDRARERSSASDSERANERSVQLFVAHVRTAAFSSSNARSSMAWWPLNSDGFLLVVLVLCALARCCLFVTFVAAHRSVVLRDPRRYLSPLASPRLPTSPLNEECSDPCVA